MKKGFSLFECLVYIVCSGMVLIYFGRMTLSYHLFLKEIPGSSDRVLHSLFTGECIVRLIREMAHKGGVVLYPGQTCIVMRCNDVDVGIVRQGEYVVVIKGVFDPLTQSWGAKRSKKYGALCNRLNFLYECNEHQDVVQIDVDAVIAHEPYYMVVDLKGI